MSITYSTVGQVKRTTASTIDLTINNLSSYTLVFVAGSASMSITSVSIGADALTLVGSYTGTNYKIMAFGVINSVTGARTITIAGNTGWYGAHAIVFDNCSKAEFVSSAYHETGHIYNDFTSFGWLGPRFSESTGWYYPPYTEVVDCFMVGWADALLDCSVSPLISYPGSTMAGSQTYGTTSPAVTYPPMSSISYRLTSGALSRSHSQAITSGTALAVSLSPYVPFTGRAYIIQ